MAARQYFPCAISADSEVFNCQKANDSAFPTALWHNNG
jgi:hypothetical protein